jgi:hypothetical protein
MTVRGLVLSIHVYESSSQIEKDYGHIGYKGRGSIQGLSLSHSSKAARTQAIEILPATRIRRTGLRTSASNRAIDQTVNNPLWTDPEMIQLDTVFLSSRC